MENEIYITNDLAATIDHLPDRERDKVSEIIDSLSGDGWKNSQIVSGDNSPGGGLRARLSGDLHLLFRYAPEQHAIIVVDVASMRSHQLAAAS